MIIVHYIICSIRFLHFDFPAATSSLFVDGLLDPSHVVLDPGIDCHRISPGTAFTSVHLMRAGSETMKRPARTITSWHVRIFLLFKQGNGGKMLKTDQANQHCSAIRLHGVKGTS